MTEAMTRDAQMQQNAFEVLHSIQIEGKPAPDNFEERVAKNPYLRFVVAADTARDTLAEIGRTVTEAESAKRQACVALGYIKDLAHMTDTIVRAANAGEDGEVDRSVIEGCGMFDAPEDNEPEEELFPDSVVDAIWTLVDYLNDEDK